MTTIRAYEALKSLIVNGAIPGIKQMVSTNYFFLLSRHLKLVSTVKQKTSCSIFQHLFLPVPALINEIHMANGTHIFPALIIYFEVEEKTELEEVTTLTTLIFSP